MSKRRKQRRSYSITLIRYKVKRKSIEKKEGILHISDSKVIEYLKNANIERIEIKVFVLFSPKFAKVNVKALSKGLKPVIYRLNTTTTSHIPLHYTLVLSGKKYPLKIPLDFFKRHPIGSFLKPKMRINLSSLSFKSVNVSTIMAFKGKVRLLHKPTFISKRINRELNVKGIMALSERNMSIMDKLLLEVDIGKLIFGEPLESVGLAGSRYIGEPFIIITNEELWYVVAELCKEAYQENRGSLPRPYIISSNDELKNLIDLGEKLSDRILIIRKPLEVFKRDVVLISKVIMEMFSQGLGFLILVAGNREEERKLSRLLLRDFIYKPKILRALGEGLGDKGKAGALFSLMLQLWGLKIPLEGPPKTVLRMLLADLIRKYKDFIDANLKFNKYLYRVKCHKAELGKESEDHLALKALVVRYLAEKLDIPLSSIETECQIGSTIADVYAKDKGLVVEVETLYETAPAPILKVRDSVLKYKDANEVSEIWVVLRNFASLIHFRNLLRLLNMLREELRDKEVKFYVADINRNTLKDIEEIKRDIVEKICLEKRDFELLKI